MSHVAFVTDSATDMPPDVAAAQGITVVPLVVSFGPESFRPASISRPTPSGSA